MRPIFPTVILALIFLFQSSLLMGSSSPFISCNGSPKPAILEIPNRKISEWARIVCTIYGHAIFPTNRYFWTMYGGFAPIILTAQKDTPDYEPKEVGNEIFFEEIVAMQLRGEEATRIFNQAKFGDSYPAQSMPNVFLIKVKSSAGFEQELYFLEDENGLSGAMPYPKWMDNYDNRELLPFFILDKEKAL